MNHALSLLLALAFAVPAGARIADQTAPPLLDKEYCGDGRVVAVSLKAKTVAAYCDARSHFRAAKGVTGVYALGALLGGNIAAMSEASDAYDRAQHAMFEARAKAVSAGALTVAVAGEETVVTVTLVKGVDYRLEGR